jgi:hypothetical protein
MAQDDVAAALADGHEAMTLQDADEGMACKSR